MARILIDNLLSAPAQGLAMQEIICNSLAILRNGVTPQPRFKPGN